ncbi:MAG: class I SAM-dependent methyltransferase, partial [Nostoc sp.]
QSGNSSELTIFNAHIEGVVERIEVVTGDMRDMPFPDATFDVVVSCLAIHNIYSKQGRTEAIREIARVVKPGGRVALIDYKHTQEYAQSLQSLGWQHVKHSTLDFSIFPPIRIVTGKKQS